MPCPHNEISIVQRSQQQSAVAAAAYQSGEKLFCEYDQEVKHYPEKRGIVHNEILLPENAPPEDADRNTRTRIFSRCCLRPFVRIRSRVQTMNILVIGNGFDLAHGLPTKYTDFLGFVALPFLFLI